MGHSRSVRVRGLYGLYKMWDYISTLSSFGALVLRYKSSRSATDTALSLVICVVQHEVEGPRLKGADF